MIHSIFGKYDATLYEKYANKNTGLDSVLDLSKLIFASGTTSVAYNNRALLKFDLTDTSQSIVNNNISANRKFYLNLYAVEAYELPTDQTILIAPVSQSWDAGIGKYVNSPETTEGVTWIQRTSLLDWSTGSYAANSTASWSTNNGGGTWYTNLIASSSLSSTTIDIRVDVTSIVENWLNNTIPNNGFIIYKQNESLADNQIVLKYFSSDTNTIYLPKLEVAWDNAVYNTGSLSQPSANKEILVYIQNLKKAYKETSKVRWNVGVREKYPIITFATQSNYLTVNYLPSSSFFYSIQHADTQETVIPFDTTYTKVSCTSSGNFIDIWLDGLQPERYYKIVFRVDRDGSEEYIDNNYVFKVVK